MAKSYCPYCKRELDFTADGWNCVEHGIIPNPTTPEKAANEMKCPKCGSKVVVKGTDFVCTNSKCLWSSKFAPGLKMKKRRTRYPEKMELEPEVEPHRGGHIPSRWEKLYPGGFFGEKPKGAKWFNIQKFFFAMAVITASLLLPNFFGTGAAWYLSFAASLWAIQTILPSKTDNDEENWALLAMKASFKGLTLIFLAWGLLAVAPTTPFMRLLTLIVFTIGFVTFPSSGRDEKYLAYLAMWRTILGFYFAIFFIYAFLHVLNVSAMTFISLILLSIAFYFSWPEGFGEGVRDKIKGGTQFFIKMGGEGHGTLGFGIMLMVIGASMAYFLGGIQEGFMGTGLLSAPTLAMLLYFSGIMMIILGAATASTTEAMWSSIFGGIGLAIGALDLWRGAHYFAAMGYNLIVGSSVATGAASPEARPIIGITALSFSIIILTSAYPAVLGEAVFGAWWPQVEHGVREFVGPISMATSQMQSGIQDAWLMFSCPSCYYEQQLKKQQAAGRLKEGGTVKALEVTRFDFLSEELDPTQPLSGYIELENKGEFPLRNINAYLLPPQYTDKKGSTKIIDNYGAYGTYIFTSCSGITQEQIAKLTKDNTVVCCKKKFLTKKENLPVPFEWVADEFTQTAVSYSWETKDNCERFELGQTTIGEALPESEKEKCVTGVWFIPMVSEETERPPLYVPQCKWEGETSYPTDVKLISVSYGEAKEQEEKRWNYPIKIKTKSGIVGKEWYKINECICYEKDGDERGACNPSEGDLTGCKYCRSTTAWGLAAEVVTGLSAPEGGACNIAEGETISYANGGEFLKFGIGYSFEYDVNVSLAVDVMNNSVFTQKLKDKEITLKEVEAKYSGGPVRASIWTQRQPVRSGEKTLGTITIYNQGIGGQIKPYAIYVLKMPNTADMQLKEFEKLSESLLKCSDRVDKDEYSYVVCATLQTLTQDKFARLSFTFSYDIGNVDQKSAIFLGSVQYGYENKFTKDIMITRVPMQ